ncbi:DUF4176 domain-containing protein [Furfurilactobacillus rossiae]|uniref:DUF4176 domain-containing protein n=1 Tax=Furfurilactobacillus rossiae DSM 15814 TaxID=1114972 RepID=A0A0R1RCK4_9LACO|nr:DUF4176 domain-containing protein [Furfurilactobacillus rossiae]KRL52900.1 hypothetical protein FD35_GL001796 [Furfurilactobacillus rossiae DSM 15814]QFR65615.1 DUF4176 domain-containing protein [Furfurilactobacillus rossiae]QFR68009.1 DUF4176 domain-containing protein [Furfurilactobacillus rossiae]QLE61003.1 hypothetical protein LROSRS0_0956 [Furfurilactobacillus rossiae]
MNKILPLGSVVTINDNDEDKFMIVGRASIVKQGDEKVYFDYGAVLVPNGMIDAESTFFFNRENVNEVLHQGYIDDAEKELEENYDQWIEEDPDIVKGSVEATDNE